jgi:7-cyano-7-deazaguanine synthase
MSVGILLSGGMDSTALAYWKRPDVALTINYGQVCAEAEIQAASQICKELTIEHEIISVDCSSLGSGDLSGLPPDPIAPVPEWWPFRNQLLLTLASMRAIKLGVDTLLFGSVKSDFIHIDGRKEFFEKINDITSLQEGSIHIEAPAVELSSAELIKLSGIERPILAWAHSCHVSNFACGSCRGCYKHQAVMAELGYGAY